MKSEALQDFKAAFSAEIQKLYKLRTHVVLLAVTLSLLGAALVLEYVATRYAGQQGKTKAPVNLNTIWQIFHFFSQYVTPIVISLIVAFQTGKEFEWKTFHQIQLKGQTPATYVLSKLATFFALATGTYLLQLIVVALFYGVRALIEGQGFDMPAVQVAADLLYALLAISFGLLIAVVTVSASVGIVLTLVYLCVLEMMIFPLFGSLMGMLNQHGAATALSYAPMKLPGQFVTNAENFPEGLIVLLATLALLFGLGWLSYTVVNRRQIGLIR